jgi:hypothetical protein
MKRGAPLFSLVLALAGCASVHVTSDFDDTVDFSRLHAYVWAPQEKPADPVVADTLVENRIRNAVDRELAAKGYRRVDGAPPDFVVDFATAMRERVDYHSWPSWCWGHYHYGYGWGYGYHGWHDRVDVIQYVQGTLLVGMLDPTTNQLLWRGKATEIVDDKSGSEARIDEAVKLLLADFPPQVK